MIASTAVPTIPWTAWLILIPIQIVLDAGFIWVTWWVLMKHDPDRMSPNTRIAFGGIQMAAMMAFTVGTLLSEWRLLNPTRDPRHGPVVFYYFGAAAIPPMLVACYILWLASKKFTFSPEAIKRNKGVRVAEFFFPSDRPNISFSEAEKLAKEQDRAWRHKPSRKTAPPAKPAVPPKHSATYDADLEAMERQMGITPPKDKPPEGRSDGND